MVAAAPSPASPARGPGGLLRPVTLGPLVSSVGKGFQESNRSAASR